MLWSGVNSDCLVEGIFFYILGFERYYVERLVFFRFVVGGCWGFWNCLGILRMFIE